ncbi:MAG: hypothetical protein WDN30_10270 [Pararobbsia sp.]
MFSFGIAVRPFALELAIEHRMVEGVLQPRQYRVIAPAVHGAPTAPQRLRLAQAAVTQFDRPAWINRSRGGIEATRTVGGTVEPAGNDGDRTGNSGSHAVHIRRVPHFTAIACFREEAPHYPGNKDDGNGRPRIAVYFLAPPVTVRCEYGAGIGYAIQIEVAENPYDIVRFHSPCRGWRHLRDLAQADLCRMRCFS